TMVEVDRAILVHVHQRTGLIEMRGGEGDAEFDWRQRDPALERRAFGVERRDLAPSRAIVAGRLAPVYQGTKDIVLDEHAVGCDVAAFGIQIELADVEWIELERPCDLVDRALRDHHALRAAEAA